MQQLESILSTAGEEEVEEQSLSSSNDGSDLESGTDSEMGRPHNRNDDPNNNNNEIAVKEARQVRLGKTLFFSVLGISAIALGFVTYHYLSRQQEEAFQNEVRNHVICRISRPT